MKTEAKFKRGDLVGWKSDSEFTASNKLKPAMKVTICRYNPKEGWLYMLTNNVGIVSEHEIELRF